MTSAPDADDGAAALDVRKQLKNAFRDIDERLRGMTEEYEENPSSIDSGVLSAARNPVNVQSAITEAYKLMNARIYASNSPLRADPDLWEAFQEQKDGFTGFYKAALRALETFKTVLEASGLVKKAPLNRGDLEKVRLDARALAEARDDCIAAVTLFYQHFSTMLGIL